MGSCVAGGLALGSLSLQQPSPAAQNTRRMRVPLRKDRLAATTARDRWAASLRQASGLKTLASKAKLQLHLDCGAINACTRMKISSLRRIFKTYHRCGQAPALRVTEQ